MMVWWLWSLFGFGVALGLRVAPNTGCCGSCPGATITLTVWWSMVMWQSWEGMIGYGGSVMVGHDWIGMGLLFL